MKNEWIERQAHDATPLDSAWKIMKAGMVELHEAEYENGRIRVGFVDIITEDGLTKIFVDGHKLPGITECVVRFTVADLPRIEYKQIPERSTP
jgi:hypothetical protein